MKLPFFAPYYGAREERYAADALRGADYTAKARQALAAVYGAHIFLTTSASAAFELLFASLGLERGGEVIMPSFTYPSCANSIVRAGLKPVFAEIGEKSLALDESSVLSIVNGKTRAVMPMHYGASSMALDAFKSKLPDGVLLIEDAALCFGAKYRGRPLGTVGDMGVLSFHRTKNISADEGGLLIFSEKHAKLAQRAQTIYDNGTDRAAFLRGEVNAYTWQEAGMNVAMGNLNAALLCAQLAGAEEIVARHRKIYLRYLENLSGLAARFGIVLPDVPEENENNYELFYMLLPSEAAREHVQKSLGEKGIGSAFHYMALHASAMGRRLGYAPEDLPVTQSVCGRLLRLPLFAAMTLEACDEVSRAVEEALCGM